MLMTNILIVEQLYGVEYCPFERFRAQCLDNEIIMITHARYGRMRIGKRIEAGLGKCNIARLLLTYVKEVVLLSQSSMGRATSVC